MALVKGARNGGAKIVEGVAVQRLLKDGDKCVGVETEDGRAVLAESVVMAAGMWTRQLAETIGVNVPLQACEHFYIVTEPLEGVPRDMPIVRDPSNYTYFKEETGKLMVGFFEPKGKHDELRFLLLKLGLKKYVRRFDKARVKSVCLLRSMTAMTTVRMTLKQFEMEEADMDLLSPYILGSASSV